MKMLMTRYQLYNIFFFISTEKIRAIIKYYNIIKGTAIIFIIIKVVNNFQSSASWIIFFLYKIKSNRVFQKNILSRFNSHSKLTLFRIINVSNLTRFKPTSFLWGCCLLMSTNILFCMLLDLMKYFRRINYDSFEALLKC